MMEKHVNLPRLHCTFIRKLCTVLHGLACCCWYWCLSVWYQLIHIHTHTLTQRNQKGNGRGWMRTPAQCDLEIALARCIVICDRIKVRVPVIKIGNHKRSVQRQFLSRYMNFAHIARSVNKRLTSCTMFISNDGFSSLFSIHSFFVCLSASIFSLLLLLLFPFFDMRRRDGIRWKIVLTNWCCSFSGNNGETLKQDPNEERRKKTTAEVQRQRTCWRIRTNACTLNKIEKDEMRVKGQRFHYSIWNVCMTHDSYTAIEQRIVMMYENSTRWIKK